MAKVEFAEDIVAFRGRGCKQHKNGRIFVKRANGTTYYYHLHNPSTAQTAAQLAQRQKFKEASAATLAAMTDVEQMAAYAQEFKKQRKYSTLRGFIFAQEMAKLQ